MQAVANSRIHSSEPCSQEIARTRLRRSIAGREDSLPSYAVLGRHHMTIHATKVPYAGMVVRAVVLGDAISNADRPGWRAWAGR